MKSNNYVEVTVKVRGFNGMDSEACSRQPILAGDSFTEVVYTATIDARERARRALRHQMTAAEALEAAISAVEGLGGPKAEAVVALLEERFVLDGDPSDFGKPTT